MPDATAASQSSAPKVLCANCGVEVPLGAVGPCGIASCKGCGKILDLDPILPARPVPAPEPDVAVPARWDEQPVAAPLLLRRDAPFPMPQKAEVVDVAEHLTLSIPDTLDRLPLAAALGAVGLAGITAFLIGYGRGTQFSLPLALAVIAAAYLVLQAVVNSRHFRADASGLHTRTGPLPWLRRSLKQEGVTELFVERNWTEAGRGRYRFIWELYARTPTDPKVPLFEGGSDPVLVHWLGQRLAKRLGAKFSPARGPSEARR